MRIPNEISTCQSCGVLLWRYIEGDDITWAPDEARPVHKQDCLDAKAPF